MSLEKGKATFRVILTGSRKIDTEFEDAFTALGYSSTPSDDEYEVVDVSRGRSLWGGSNLEMPEGWVKYGSNLYFALRTRTKQIDKKTFSEYVEHLIEQEVAETDNYPTGKRKKALKMQAKETLAAMNMETVKGIRVLAPIGGKCLLVEGSAKNAEKIQDLVQQNVKDVDTFLFTPDFLFNLNSKKDTNAGFYDSYKIQGQTSEMGIGADFLTWLWMASETAGILDDTIVALCGDMVFKGDSESSQSSATLKLSKGTPWEGMGPKAAFDEGKKVVSARFRFMTGGRTWEVTLDEQFGMSQFDIIDGVDENLDMQSMMDERATAITDFLKILTNIFYKFMALSQKNEELVDTWVDNRWEMEDSDNEAESTYSVLTENDEVVIENVDLGNNIVKSSTLNILLEWLIKEFPDIKELLKDKKRPAVLIDKARKEIVIVDMDSELTPA